MQKAVFCLFNQLLFLLLALHLVQNSSQAATPVDPQPGDVGARTIDKFFDGRSSFEVTDDTKPVMKKKTYVNVQDMKSFNEYVKQGTLVFNRITFYGKRIYGPWSTATDKTHTQIDENGRWVRNLAYRSVGRLELKIESFDAEVTWTPPSGPNRTCEIVGLSKCTDGLAEAPQDANVLRIYYDNAIILYPWVEVSQNTFKESETRKTLQFKSYMKNCKDVSAEEGHNVTAGIDYLFMNEKVKTVLVNELGRQYQEVLMDVRDRITPVDGGIAEMAFFAPLYE